MDREIQQEISRMEPEPLGLKLEDCLIHHGIPDTWDMGVLNVCSCNKITVKPRASQTIVSFFLKLTFIGVLLSYSVVLVSANTILYIYMLPRWC